jgi:hypothetical protein
VNYDICEYVAENDEYVNAIEVDCTKDIVANGIEYVAHIVDCLIGSSYDTALNIVENGAQAVSNPTDWVAVATIIAAAVALYAAVQPWIIAFINKKRNKVVLIPNEHITIYYGRDGLSIQFFFTLVSEHTDNVVKGIRIMLIGSDESKHEFKWDTFRSTHYESIYATKAPRNSPARDTEFSRGVSSYAHPIYLRAQVAQLMNVIFTEIDVKTPVQLKLKSGTYKVVVEITNTGNKCYTDDKYEIAITDSNIKDIESQRSRELAGKTDNQKPVMIDIVDVSKKKRAGRDGAK